MSKKTTLPYLAGAMDSDGYFTIKRSTYRLRVRGDATQPVYSERIGLKQVTPHIVELLQNTFGGYVGRQRGVSVNSKPLWSWQATDRAAANACLLLLPYLTVKKRQCELLVELRKSKQPQYLRFAFWFEHDHPECASMPMLTAL